MGFSLGRLLGSPLRATSQLLHGKPLQAFKTGVTGGGTAPFASKAPFLGGGMEAAGPAAQSILARGIGGLIRRRPLAAPESPEAQSYFGTFSPEDQGNIRSSLARGGNLNDWFRNAQAAGAAPQTPTAPPMSGGGPFSGIAGAVANMVKMNQIKKQLPPKMNPDDEMGGGPAPY